MFERDPDPEKLADPEAIDRADMQSAQTCRLLIDESISGTMLRVSSEDGSESKRSSAKSGDAASADDDLIGENQIAIRIGAGSGCNRVLSAQGGPFLMLPCSAHYDLTGKLAGE
jgi:streptomycin 6-kinase